MVEAQRQKILLADDESSLAEALRMTFTDAGYDFCWAPDGAKAVELFAAERPDLVILDVMMPRLDGFGVCERIRRVDPEVPVVMLSARGDIVDKRVGFRTGADDYLTKPFDEDEILLRVEALLARRDRMRAVATEGDGSRGGEPPRTIEAGDVCIDLYRHEVRVRGEAVELTPKEFQILALLADNPGRAFTREDLIDLVWGSEYQGSAISIPVYVRRIRAKIEEDPSRPRYLKTVWNHGYRFCAE